MLYINCTSIKLTKSIPITCYKLVTLYTNFTLINNMHKIFKCSFIVIFWPKSFYTTSNHYAQSEANNTLKICWTLLLSFKNLPQFPIILRINSKVLITKVYKALCDLAPPFLSQLISSHFPSPLLCTSNTELLAISWARQEHTQFRAFTFVHSFLWNAKFSAWF